MTKTCESCKYFNQETFSHDDSDVGICQFFKGKVIPDWVLDRTNNIVLSIKKDCQAYEENHKCHRCPENDTDANVDLIRYDCYDCYDCPEFDTHAGICLIRPDCINFQVGGK